VVGDTTFDQVRIVNAGLAGAGSGVVAAKGAVGSATFNNVAVVNPKTMGWQDNAPEFNLIRGEDNSGSKENQQSSADGSDARRASVRS
jgi:hypothetical protein